MAKQVCILENREYIGNRPIGERIQIIDVARGISIILMVIYHFHIDLVLLEMMPSEILERPAIVLLQQFFACIFILTSGISCIFSKNNLKRGLILLAVAMVVTAVTYIYSPDLVVRFGILHFLGVSAIIYALAGKAIDALLPGFLTPLAGVLLAALTWNLRDLTFNVDFLWAFGIVNSEFSSSDYFPLLPYFFIYLIGTWFGKYVVAGKLPRWFYEFKCPPLAFVGRNTIWIYLLHQPVLFGALYLVKHL
jgi:uncharacterized membrane protein